jgi:uncharacterized protein YdbL (DUF1318 family)
VLQGFAILRTLAVNINPRRRAHYQQHAASSQQRHEVRLQYSRKKEVRVFW